MEMQARQFKICQLGWLTVLCKKERTHTHAYDLVPKGAQEKRTDVLENKVDRM